MKMIDENKGTRPQRIATAVALIVLPLIYFLPVFIWNLALAPGDGLTQNLGVRVLIGQMLRAGQLPLWNPYIFAGTPLLASIYPGALYPPNWVFAILPPSAAMNFVVITTYHVTLIGAYLYARRIGVNRIGALVAGLAFSFGGFMMAHAGHTSRIAAAAWLPWVLLAIEHLYWRISWRWVALGAAFIALQLFAGEPQMNFYTVLVCGAYAVVSLTMRERQETRGRFIAGLAAMGVCGLLLSMIQLLPERELLQMGERAGISYEYFSGYSFPPKQILTFIFPFFFGGAVSWPYRVEYWGSPTLDELCGYFGLATLLLALVAIVGNRFADRQRALIWFWLGVAVVSLILSFGGFLPFGLNHVLHRTPVYNLFRASGRHLYEFTFSLGVLAGLGVTLLAQADREFAKRAFKWAAIIFAVLVAATWMIYRFAGGAMEIGAEGVRKPGFNALANPEALVPLLFALLSVIAVWYYLHQRASASGVLLIGVLFLDLVTFALAFNWGWRDFMKGVGDRLKDSPPVAFIKSREPDLNSFRIASYSPAPFAYNYDYLDFPNVSIARGLQSVNGYDALRLLRQSAITGDMGSDGVISGGGAFGGEHQGLNLLNVKYLLYEKTPVDIASSPDRFVKIDDVFFCREHVYQTMEAGSKVGITANNAPASELVLVTTMANSTHVPDGTVVLRIRLHTKDGRVIERGLQAGRDTAEWAYDKPDVRVAIKHSRPKVAESEPAEGFAANRYLARLPFDRAEIERIEMEYALPDAALLIMRASLFDATTATSTPLETVDFHPERWRSLANFGNVFVLENLQARPRAWFVQRAAILPSKDVLQAIKTGKLPVSAPGGLAAGSPFDPAETALFEKEDFGERQASLPPISDPMGAEAKVARYEPNRIELETRNPQDGLLCLSEIYYRGWEAWIDGKRAPVEKINYTLRGVFVPAGNHHVQFIYRAHSFRNGAAYSLLGLLLLLGGAIAARTNNSSGRAAGAGLAARLAKKVRGLSWAQRLTLVMLALLAAYTFEVIKHASYAVGGSDSAGYANIARSLLHGPIAQPITDLDRFGLGDEYAGFFTSLAYNPILKDHKLTRIMAPIYPVGFPLHLAVGALALGWRYGPFLVSPLIGALSLVLLFLTARMLGLSRGYAFAGCALLAANPTFLLMISQPMSDATAMFWGLMVVWAGLRSRHNERWALVAGAAFGVAFLVRPTNIVLLAPLAFCLRLKPKVLLLFVLGGLPLAAIFGAFNWAAFGHPLQTGYTSINLQDLITTSGAMGRVNFYVYWVGMTMSPLALLGWIGVAPNPRIEWRTRALLIAWFGAFFAFYIFYDVYDAWWYTRFVLPGYPGLLLGAVFTGRELCEALARKKKALAWAIGLALLAVALGFESHYVSKYQIFRVGKWEYLHAESCQWADAQLPSKALIVALEMTGSLKYYTGRPTVRWDYMTPEMWPHLRKQVQQSGYQFYALLMSHELDQARQNVPGRWNELGRLRHISLWQVDAMDKAPPRLEYVRGFSAPERDAAGDSWRWMGDEGVVRLENSGRPMRLRVTGNVPLDSLPQPATVQLTLNGKVIHQVTAREKGLNIDLIITPEQMAGEKWSELQIRTDQTFSPHELNPQSTDDRRLGFSLTGLTWEDAAPPK